MRESRLHTTSPLAFVTGAPPRVSPGSAAFDGGSRPERGRHTTVEQIMRREFFARAALPAGRYSIGPDAVVAHCARHRPTSPLGASRMIANLEDLTHAVACLQAVGLAWSDLTEAVEPGLTSAVRTHVGDAMAVVQVRRWLGALRHRSETGWRELACGRDGTPTSAPGEASAAGAAAMPWSPAGAAVPPRGSPPAPATLLAYSGVRPLRLWLAERLLGELAAAANPGSGWRLRLTGGSFDPSMRPEPSSRP